MENYGLLLTLGMLHSVGSSIFGEMYVFIYMFSADPGVSWI